LLGTLILVLGSAINNSFMSFFSTLKIIKGSYQNHRTLPRIYDKYMFILM